MSDGVKDHPLCYGNLNYWVLREWASHCLGRDSREIGECPLGEKFGFVRALDPEEEHAVPSIYAKHIGWLSMPGYVGRVTIDGVDMSWEAFQDRISVAQPVVWNGYGFYYDEVEGNLQSVRDATSHLVYRPSAYRLFASRALISESGGDYSREYQFAKVQVPFVPLLTERNMETVVYRKSLFSGDESVKVVLAENGYAYLVDDAEHAIYYTNSVAVIKGYPPVASAMGWHKVPLKHLPSDWIVQLDEGRMVIGNT
jgi:hypothetical protein